ncbi:MAG: phosphotransferase family protein [Actinobacteria bacterium]|nr:phosphotransferase family protein [Actinomycetota bacterium]
MTEPISAEDVIARIDDWKGRDVRFVELGGGITNRNYLVTVDGEAGAPGVGRFVLRIPGEGTETFIDRTRELVNHAAAAAAGVAPPLLHVIQPGDCTIVPFITGETMHPESLAGHADRLEKVVGAMRTYHEKAVFAEEVRLFDMVRNYLRMAAQVNAPRPEETDWMLEQGRLIEAAMERDQPAFTACHNDLLSENFILAPDGKMWVIDWEYGGMNDPYFDLGDFCVEHPLSVDEEKLVLTAYCGGMDEHRYARMQLHKLIADLWWSIWAMIQASMSTLDFDFYEYGMNRIRRFQSNAADPDYEVWLESV